MLRTQRWFYSLLLLLVSSVAFADSSGSSSTIAADAVSNHTDLSINFLSQLFGTVGNSLSGTSGQMLGKLFYELNVGILVVAGMWMSYTIVTLVFGAATEGGFMSGRNNLILAFLKIAIGVGLLIPSPTTGYSPIQDVVMKVVVKSVELADMTWDHGLHYLSEGGAVWRPPAASKDGGLDQGNFTGIYNKVIVPTFNAEVCMIEHSVSDKMNSNSNDQSYSSDALDPINNQNNMSFDFPSSKDPSQSKGCGSFNWGDINGASKKGKKTTMGEYAYEAAYKVVYGILPAAKNYACSVSKSVKGSICEGLSKQIDFPTDSEVMFNNTLGYVNTITPLVISVQHGVDKNAYQFMQTAQNQGWILAGRYSWDLSHLKDQMYTVQNVATFVPPDFQNGDAANNHKMPGDDGSDPMSRLAKMVQNKYANYAQTSDNGNNNNGSFGGHGHWGSIAPLVNAFYGDVKKLINQFSSHVGSDPVYFLHRVGVLCINIAGDIWIDLALIAGLLMMVGMICSGGSVDLDRPIEAAVGWFKPLAMALAGIFIASGSVLAFYVPVYAFFIFTFGVVSWFILVIEAMVAAPLVAFGLTHPQGHDFLGKVEQSVMLLLSVFLRPVLMIIGLFAAMILAFIAFRMTNFGFAAFMSDVFTIGKAAPWVSSNVPTPLAGMNMFMDHGSSQASLGQVAMVLIGMPILLLMYSMAVYLIVNQCYSLVYKLPDYIMRWIGGPQSDSGFAGMMQELKGSAQNTSSGMSSGAGESVMASSKAVSKYAGSKVGGLFKKGEGGQSGHEAK